ncbi:hypothetical protein [Nonomuraea soli]|uniref:Ca2+-binding EF-hand superfamily protein n=1 Tax=Nonomuraea soli TaxID=1032476 RepID=A0A7W0HNT7_9ACTN|nr:hypothetical protein [Nonomuraea soli]MBA2890154.1 Ca2+-binding EF-hand superfamily protein [Nonomuraea soli]
MARPAARDKEPIQEERDTFDLFDSDHDGRLSPVELLLGLTVTGQHITLGDIDFLIGLTPGEHQRGISRTAFESLRRRAPSPFYGELLYSRFDKPVDAKALRTYLLSHGIDVSHERIAAFLRNLHPEEREVLPREVFEALVRRYRR